MLNYNHWMIWITKVVLHRETSKYTAEDLERPTPEAKGKDCSEFPLASICRLDWTGLRTL